MSRQGRAQVSLGKKWSNSEQPQVDSHLAASVNWGPFLRPIPSRPQPGTGFLDPALPPPGAGVSLCCGGCSVHACLPATRGR